MSRLVYARPLSEIMADLGRGEYAVSADNPLRIDFTLADVVIGSIEALVENNRVRQVVLTDAEGTALLSLTGLALPPAPIETLAAGIQTSLDLYAVAIELLADDTTVIGSDGADELDCGRGNDTVSGGAGDDLLYRAADGDLVFDGGAGRDRLVFASMMVLPNQPGAPAGALVDLAQGQGSNPWGGSLRLTSVEDITGTALADTIRGDDRANVIGDGLFDTGADVIACRGGDDTVYLSHQSTGARVDGGDGRDTLLFSTHAEAILVRPGVFRPGVATLDLLAAGTNSGAFEGVTVRGFEVFRPSGLLAESSIFRFRGSNRAEDVTGLDGIPGTALPSGMDRLYGRGGDDRLSGLSARDLLDGGAGDDRLLGGVGRDTLIGGAGRDTLIGGGSADLFVFAPDDSPAAAPDRIAGFAGADRIDLRAFGGLDAVSALTGAGQLLIDRDGATTWLRISTDADAAPETVIEVGGVLTLADLWLA